MTNLHVAQMPSTLLTKSLINFPQQAGYDNWL
jgi:hypothetical protein